LVPPEGGFRKELAMGYLKETPRRSWERIALIVEDALPNMPRAVARRAPAPDLVAVRTAVAPFAASAN
jgi:hypothetical protein